jgi:sec-independent protein translocase protein TatA
MFESLMMFVGGYEWVWIIVIVGVLLFGAKKIPELARTLGKSRGEFEKGKLEGDKELKDVKENSDEKTS